MVRVKGILSPGTGKVDRKGNFDIKFWRRTLGFGGRKVLRASKFGRGQIDISVSLRLLPPCSERKSKGPGTSKFWKGKGSKDPHLGTETEAGAGEWVLVSGQEEDSGILSSLSVGTWAIRLRPATEGHKGFQHAAIRGAAQQR